VYVPTAGDRARRSKQWQLAGGPDARLFNPASGLVHVAIGQPGLVQSISAQGRREQDCTSLARSESEAMVGIGPAPADHPHVRVETIKSTSSTRPGGKRFGALVHEILASIELTNESDIEQSASLSGRLIGATAEEIQAAISVVRAALEHPVLRRAAAKANELRRETPVVLRLEDGTIGEGVIDLAYPDDGPDFAGWTIVDFKTDREFAASSDRYISQIRLYAEAMGSLMDCPTRGVLLVV